MPIDDRFLEMIRVTDGLRENAISSIITKLGFAKNSCGIDAGCGVGTHTFLLAKAVGPTGHVTGIDISPENTEYAIESAKLSGFANQTKFIQADIQSLDFQDNTFDWAWSSDCVGYAPLNPMLLLAELARVTRPGGAVVILAWSHETLLPGYPLLEARLRSTEAGVSPFPKDGQPNRHFLRALGWFRALGLINPTAQTMAGCVHAPLTDDQRSALKMLFEMRWPNVASELSAEDYADFQRLCLPQSPDYIVDHPDYYAFFTYSVFSATVPEAG